jgi:hypothetical protein
MGGGIRRWARSHEEAGIEGGGTCLPRPCAGLVWARVTEMKTWWCWAGRTARSLSAPRHGEKTRPCTASSRCCKATVTHAAAFRQWPARALGDAGETYRAVCGRSGRPGPRRRTGATTHATAAHSVHLILVGPSGDCRRRDSAITLKFSLLEDY